MDKNEILTLEKTTYSTDSLEQLIPVSTETRKVFCSVKSASRAEWSAAAHRDLKPAYCITIWADEYCGEVTAIYEGERYSIYRTYRRNHEEIELYLEQRVGA